VWHNVVTKTGKRINTHHVSCHFPDDRLLAERLLDFPTPVVPIQIGNAGKNHCGFYMPNVCLSANHLCQSTGWNPTHSSQSSWYLPFITQQLMTKRKVRRYLNHFNAEQISMLCGPVLPSSE